MRSLSIRFIFIIIIISGVGISDIFAAQNAQTGGGPGARERISYIQTALDEGKKNAQIWWGLWIAGYGGLAAGQYIFAGVAGNYSRNESRSHQLRQDFHIGCNKSTFPRKEQWVNYLVGGVKCTLSMGMLLVMPFAPAYAPGKLASMPEGTDEEVGKKLTEAERLLELCARKEKMGRSWWKHLLGVGVNAAGSIIIWRCQKGKDPWKDALVSFFSGMAVYELTIWTQPTRAIEDWDSYRMKYRGGAYHEEDVNRWFITLCSGGLAAGVYF